MLEKDIAAKIREFIAGADADTLRETVELLVAAVEKDDATPVVDAFYQPPLPTQPILVNRQRAATVI